MNRAERLAMQRSINRQRMMQPGAVLLLILMLGACRSAPVPMPTPGEDRVGPLSTTTDADRQLYTELLSIDPPPFDQVAGAIALRGIDEEDIPATPVTPAQTYDVGDHQSFWVHNSTTFETVEVGCQLMAKSDHVYLWWDVTSNPANAEGHPPTAQDWQTAAEKFEDSYAAVQSVFGSEDTPGIDGDQHLYVIHSDKLGNVGGYFGQADQLPTIIKAHSNEGQFFYIAIDQVDTEAVEGAGALGGDYYNETLAHEFQHMVHSNIDPNEEGWMNEGLSMLAQQIAGMRGDVSAHHFIAAPDQSLWYWNSTSADYGQAYLFLNYLYGRYGEEFIRALVLNQKNGLQSIDETLAAQGASETTDQLYADFAAAIYYNSPNIGSGQYEIRDATIGSVLPTGVVDGVPNLYEGTVNQYGGIDVIGFKGSGQAVLTFTGAASIPLLPTEPHSGDTLWWSARQDASQTTLTREVDLSGVDQATLNYWAWYNIEDQWDYAYVLASTDEGTHWTPLNSTSSTDENPNDNNFGNGLTGHSGGDSPEWVQEKVDLSEFAGQKILLRFVIINDTVKNEEGFAIDDIEIPEIEWSDDTESEDGDWEADGFVRIHNRVPQQWSVQVAEELRGGGVEIHVLEVVNGKATIDVDFRRVKGLTVFVVGLTRFTTVEAPYRLEIAKE
jgi:immune inhibitor A